MVWAKTGNKYGAKRTSNGFASKRESKVAADLTLRQRIGEISELKFQVRFDLIPKIGKQQPCWYVADFTWMEGGLLHVGDAKGMLTPVYRIKKKLMKWVHDIEIEEM